MKNLNLSNKLTSGTISVLEASRSITSSPTGAATGGRGSMEILWKAVKGTGPGKIRYYSNRE